MAGWIIERRPGSGALVYDIGYRVNGRLVTRKGGATRREAEPRSCWHSQTSSQGRSATAPARRSASMRCAGWHDGRRSSNPALSGPIETTSSVASHPLGAFRLRDVTAEAIEQAILRMQRMKPRRGSGRATYSAKTINNTLTTLSVILSAAVNDGLLRQNPARRQGGAGERRMLPPPPALAHLASSS